MGQKIRNGTWVCLFFFGLAGPAQPVRAAGLAPEGPAEEEAFKRRMEEMIQERERSIQSQKGHFTAHSKDFRDAVAKQAILLRGHGPNPSPDQTAPPTVLAAQGEEGLSGWVWGLPFLAFGVLLGRLLLPKIFRAAKKG